MKASKRAPKRVDAQMARAQESLGTSLTGKIEGVSTLEFYTHLLSQFIKDGHGTEQKALQNDQLQIEYDRVYTAHGCKLFYFVKSFPREVEYSFQQEIRTLCQQGKVRVFFTQDLTSFEIDWGSYEMRTKQEFYSKHLQSSRAVRFESRTALEKAGEAEDATRENWLSESWAYVMDATRRQQALILSDCVIELVTVDNSPQAQAELRVAQEALLKYSYQNNIALKKVSSYLFDFLQRSSPFRMEEDSLSRSFISTRVLTGEIIGHFGTYSAGKSQEPGTYVAVDVSKYTAVYRNFTRVTQDAENILIVGMSGSGKSVFSKALVGNMLATFKNVVIHDRDSEYTTLCNELGGIVISLSRASGKYFDAMRIGDPTGVTEVDGGLFQESRMATTTVFNALADLKIGMTPTELRIYNDAYNHLLARAGVFADQPQTWPNSYTLTYPKLYQAIQELGRNSEYQRLYGNALKEFINKLSFYFEPDGLKSYLFQTPITITDVLGTRTHSSPPVLLTINMEVDMSGTTDQDSVDNTLRYLTSNYLSERLVNIFCALDQATFEVMDEFQRVIKNALARESAMKKITGNRKKNAITAIMTNAPQALIESLGDAGTEIVDNINNVLIGKVKATSIEPLCQTFSLHHCQGILNQFIEEETTYKHCFLMKMHSNDIKIVKQIIPEHIVKSKAFSTRTTKPAPGGE